MTLRTNAQKVQAFAGALYGVQLGTTYMSYVNADITSTGGLTNALNGYYNSSFGAVTNADVAKTVVKNLGITGTTAVADAEAYIQAQLNAAAPAARGEVIANILDLFAGGASDATYGAFVTAWNAKVEAAAAYKGADNMAMGSGVNYTLSVSQDVLMGSAVADMFTARVVQNANGEQTNQLATGDVINGGAGTDTLNARVISASSLNQDGGSAVSPETTSVEVNNFTALTRGGSAETVEINAQFMNGVTHIGSVQSNASLLVTNVNTLDNDGIYANRRDTESLTVVMDHTGNDQVINESDMTVLLDNDYLSRPDGITSADLTVAVTPQIEEEDFDAAQPLENNPYDKLSFSIDGVAKTINITSGSPAGPVETTYASLKAAIEAGLAEAGLTGVVVTQNVGALTYFSRDGEERTADTFTLSKAGSVISSIGNGTWTATKGLPDDNSFGATVIVGDANSTTTQIAINVHLEKVGRGADGGDLTIGGMATDLANNWNYSNSAIEEGIERFDVTVSGDATQFSSLASLQSTNNTLQTVNVTSAAGSKAALIIGNNNTVGYGLKDVRDFNSSAFANNVTLTAEVTDQSVAKYMDRKDEDAPAADNAEFDYTFGAGNDKLTMNISKANLAATGSTVREDFSLAINTAAGNDTVTVQIGDGEGENTDVWMVNSDLNENLSIDPGAGNDTVHAKGAGVWNIETGAGNDTVYSDNSGAQKAVWVFNTADQTTTSTAVTALFTNVADAEAVVATKQAVLDAALAADPVDTTAVNTAQNELDTAQDDLATKQAALADAPRQLADLESGANDTYDLYKGTVTVEFLGLSSEAITIAGTTANKYVTNNLLINQAIKEAINSDPVLSKLLVAQDGPANTLIVTSLIDGVRVDADLVVTFAATDDFTAAETSGMAAIEEDFEDDMAGIASDLTAGNDYTARLAVDSNGKVVVGAFSDNTALSTHNMGTGDDVVVLSTGANSAETVVFEGTSINDVVVNFTSGRDKIDLSAFGTTVTSAADSSFTSTTTTEALAAFTTGITTNPAAVNHVVILAETAGTGLARVFQVTDAVEDADNTAVLVGTIDFGAATFDADDFLV